MPMTATRRKFDEIASISRKVANRTADTAFYAALVVLLLIRQCRPHWRRRWRISTGANSIDLYVSVSVGGGYDLYARMLARHIGNHFPGIRRSSRRTWKAVLACGSPTGSTTSRRRDGTAIGAVTRATAFEPLLGKQGRAE